MSASKRCRTARAREESQNVFLGRGRMVKRNFKHCEQRDVLLAMCRDKLLQTAPPTEVLILEEVVPVGEWTLQPLPLLLLGLQDGAHVRETQSASALSTIWGPCSAAASCQGAGKHPERGVERVWSICRAEAFQSFVCWRAAGQQAQGGGNTGTGETREELEE